MVKKIALFVSLLLASVGFGLANPAPAQAVWLCQTGFVCMNHRGGVDGVTVFKGWQYESVNTCFNLTNHRDEIDYVSNAGVRAWDVWLADGCVGTTAVVYANTTGPMAGIWFRSINSVRRKY